MITRVFFYSTVLFSIFCVSTSALAQGKQSKQAEHNPLSQPVLTAQSISQTQAQQTVTLKHVTYTNHATMAFHDSRIDADKIDAYYQNETLFKVTATGHVQWLRDKKPGSSEYRATAQTATYTAADNTLVLTNHVRFSQDSQGIFAGLIDSLSYEPEENDVMLSMGNKRLYLIDTPFALPNK